MSDSRRDTSNPNERGIWAFQERVSTLLFNWNAVNIAFGLVAWARGGFWRGLGSQAIGWGLINWLIALLGSGAGQRRRASLPDPESAPVFKKEQTQLRRILWVNWGVDFLYIWGGWRFLRRTTPKDAIRAGMGVGIMLQGALLLIFDTLMLREVVALKPTDAAATDKVESDVTTR